MFNFTPKIGEKEISIVKALTTNEIEDLRNRIASYDPFQLFEVNPHNDKEIICPICGNGNGENHTGVKPSNENNHWIFHCFKCERFNGDLLSVIASENNLSTKGEDFFKVLTIGARIINFNFNLNHTTFSSNKKTKKDVPKAELDLIHTDILETQKNLRDLIEEQGGKWRGLTLETLEHFHCGYILNWIPPKIRLKYAQGQRDKLPVTSRRVILPTQNHYNAVMIDSDRNTENKSYWKMHAGHKEPFGLDFIPADADLIIIVEGEVDAMSIYQATDTNIYVFSTGGAGEKKFISELEEKFQGRKLPHIIILFDSDESGRNGANNLRENLIQRGFLVVVKFIDESDIKIDSNDILQEQGDAALKLRLDNLISAAQIEFAEIEKEMAESEAKRKSDPLYLDEETRAKLFGGGITDFDNAERLVLLFGDKFRYFKDLDRWVFYTNDFWTIAPTGKSSALFHFGRKTAEFIEFNATADADKKIAENFVKKFENHRYLSPICSMVKGLEEIYITQEDLDKHQMLLNCANGVVDLETGKLYKHDPSLYFTKKSPVVYNPECNSIDFEKFMQDVLPNEETRRAVLRYLGYCLCGDIREEKALFIVGDGRNGKGTLAKVLMAILDDYATPFKIDALLQRRFDKDGDAATPEFAKLEGRRLAIANEIPQGKNLDVAHFKDLTGGDQISIRRLHQEATTIKNPTHHFILCGQHYPEIKDANDLGLRERIIAVRFPQSFTGENCDPNLKKKLLTPENLSGALNILVQECINWQREGLIISDDMKAEKQEYLDANNFIQDFISEYCVFDADKKILRKELLSVLKENYRSEIAGLSDQALTDMLKKIEGVEYKNNIGKKHLSYFYGIGLSDEKQNSLEFAAVNKNDKTFNLQEHSNNLSDSEAEKLVLKMESEGYSNEEIIEELIKGGIDSSFAHEHLNHLKPENIPDHCIPF